MRASKETADQAIENLKAIRPIVIVSGTSEEYLKCERLMEFLQAAKSKLPREESYAKELERRRSVKKVR